MTDPRSLVLRLAGPTQSWGDASQFNRRGTTPEPTKSGLVGLLAAAEGRRRQDPIEDLLALVFGVRIDQPGTLMRDFHTVSDLRGVGLPTAAVGPGGRQKRRPNGASQLTERYYLQDAIFVVAIEAPEPILATLAHALRNPHFPLALGRRACPPTQPLLLTPSRSRDPIWPTGASDVLGTVAWQATETQRDAFRRRRPSPPTIDLPVTVDDPEGDDVRTDLPRSFDPRRRSFGTRRVRQKWVHLPSPFADAGPSNGPPHDPFALLGW